MWCTAGVCSELVVHSLLPSPRVLVLVVTHTDAMVQHEVRCRGRGWLTCQGHTTALASYAMV